MTDVSTTAEPCDGSVGEQPFLSPGEDREYAAFISYRHVPADRRWAKRILEFLETYRTPAALRKRGTRSRIRKLFRDDDELPISSDLKDEIRQALEKSAFLIVVCSPQTPESRWVQREIEMFQEMGRGDRIIPFLIAGDPETSYPLPLRNRRGGIGGTPDEAGPFDVDVRPTGEWGMTIRRRAMLRLAAKLLGCAYTDLTNRDAERRRKDLWGLAAGIGTPTVLAAGVALYWWYDTLRETEMYCASYGERWAVPFCVGELSPDGWHRRSSTYRLTLKGGQVVRMERVDGVGRLTGKPDSDYDQESWSSGIARWTIAREPGGDRAQSNVIVTLENDDGRAVREIRYDFIAGAPTKAVAVFTNKRPGVPNGIGDWQSAMGTTLGAVSDEMIVPFVPKNSVANIGQHRLTFQPDGLIGERIFEEVKTTLQISDAQGVFGRRYRYDANGLPVAILNLRDDGQAPSDVVDVAALHLIRDESGQVVAASWHDRQGLPAFNRDRIAGVAVTRNADGGIIEERFLGKEGGQPATHNSSGAAIIRTEYDPSGINPAALSYFGPDGAKILTRNGGYHRVVYEYNDKGNRTGTAFLAIDGAPVLSRDKGVARIDAGYDDKGVRTSESYLDTDGRPILAKDSGAARITGRLDDQGRVVSFSTFGLNGEPILAKVYRAARIEMRYRSQDEAVEAAACPTLLKENGITSSIEIQAFGVRNEPVVLKNLGAARMNVFFDKRGNLGAEAYYDKNGRPTLDKKNSAFLGMLGYANSGRLISIATYGLDCRLKVGRESISAALNIKYNENGRGMSISTFDAHGNAIINKRRFYKKHIEFDQYGHALQENFYGKNSEHRTTNAGYWKGVAEYDESGNITKEYYLDVNGRPTRHKSGYASYTAQYDDRGNQTDIAFFGPDGEPTLSKEGYARQVSQFDEQNRPIGFDLFGVDGKPTLHKDGYARWTGRYDATGNLREVAYFGLDGQPVLYRGSHARLTMGYDDSGNQTEEAYWGVDGKPLLNGIGVARVTMSYDDRGDLSEISYWDVEGRPVLQTAGYARRTMNYDDRGNPIEEAYWDVDGNPVLDDTGVARRTMAYDIEGSFVEEAYWDETGQPVVSRDGYARRTMNYDERWNLAEEAYWGTGGEPFRNYDGYARRTMSYDDRGNLTEEAYWDADGKPVHNRRGAARRTMKYDGRDNLAEEAYWGIDGKSVESVSGCGRGTEDESVCTGRTLNYDDYGNVTEEFYWGRSSWPGYASRAMRYDGRGNLVEKTYRDAEDRPIGTFQGLAHQTMRYDDYGNLAEIAFFDVNGEPTAQWTGHARRTMAYDGRRRPVEEAFFDADGKPAVQWNGHVRYTVSYDDRQRLVEETYWDRDGKLVAGPGYAHWTRRYDRNGNIVEEAYSDANGRPMAGNQGLARRTAVYDPRGRLVEERFEGTDGNTPANGVARRVQNYGESDVVVDVVLFAADGSVLFRGPSYRAFNFMTRKSVPPEPPSPKPNVATGKTPAKPRPVTDLSGEAGALLHKSDVPHVQKAERQAYRVQLGETIRWRNPQTGNSGSVAPMREGVSDAGSQCREFTAKLVIGGKTQTVYSTACRKPDGTWEVVR